MRDTIPRPIAIIVMMGVLLLAISAQAQQQDCSVMIDPLEASFGHSA